MRYSDGLFGRKEAPRGTATTAPTPSQAHSAAPPSLAAVPRAGAPPLAAAAPEHAHRAEEGAGSRLIVGPNIKLKGVEIDDCDTLVVEGRVEATMVSRAIQIAEIRGSFEGELTVRGRLVVHATGRVSGKVRYGKLLVQEGGEIVGDVGSLGERPGVGSLGERPGGARNA